MKYKCSTFVFRFFRIVRGITQTTNNGFSSTSAIMVFCRHKKIGFIVPICFEKQFIPSSLDAGIKVLTIYLLRDTTYIKRVINLAKLQFFHIEKNLEGRSGKIMMQYLLKIGSSIFHQYFYQQHQDAQNFTVFYFSLWFIRCMVSLCHLNKL